MNYVKSFSHNGQILLLVINDLEKCSFEYFSLLWNLDWNHLDSDDTCLKLCSIFFYHIILDLSIRNTNVRPFLILYGDVIEFHSRLVILSNLLTIMKLTLVFQLFIVTQIFTRSYIFLIRTSFPFVEAEFRIMLLCNNDRLST